MWAILLEPYRDARERCSDLLPLLADAAEDFQSRADDFKSAVDDILREEADMAAMYLTDQANGKPRKIGEDDEVELLFERFVSQ